jgi:dTDP-4-dehydrorhamnose reductase
MKQILVTGASGQLGSELKVLSELFSNMNGFADRNNSLSLDKLALESQLETIRPILY